MNPRIQSAGPHQFSYCLWQTDQTSPAFQCKYGIEENSSQDTRICATPTLALTHPARTRHTLLSTSFLPSLHNGCWTLSMECGMGSGIGIGNGIGNGQRAGVRLHIFLTFCCFSLTKVPSGADVFSIHPSRSFLLLYRSPLRFFFVYPFTCTVDMVDAFCLPNCKNCFVTFAVCCGCREFPQFFLSLPRFVYFPMGQWVFYGSLPILPSYHHQHHHYLIDFLLCTALIFYSFAYSSTDLLQLVLVFAFELHFGFCGWLASMTASMINYPGGHS